MHKSQGHAECVKVLLAAGADRKLQDGTGQTAYALGSQHESVHKAFQMASGREMTITRFRNATKGEHKAKKHVIFSATVGKGEKLVQHHGKHAALMVDTGTGETKLLAYVFIEGAVQMTELGVSKQSTEDVAKAKAAGDDEGKQRYHEYMKPLLEGLQKLEEPEFAEVHFFAATIGVTAWYRRIRDEKDREKADALVNDLRLDLNTRMQRLQPPLMVEMRVDDISGKKEALCELTAVEYAVRQSQLPPPMATLAGGSGSIQVTGLDNFFSFDASLNAGEKMCREKGVGMWQDQVRDEFGRVSRTSQGFTDNLHMAAEKEANIVLISAFYYVAVHAKIVDKKDPVYKYLSATEEVIPRLQAYVDDADNENVKEKSNAVRLITCLECLFGDRLSHVRCLFARDWTLQKGEQTVKFRTTWTAGWFLEHVAMHE